MSGAYDRWRLPELLAMVENDTDASATAHLQAWEQKHNLLLSQKQNLKALAADLAANWSPAKSEAAQTFIDQLNAHVSVLESASRTAAQIWAGLGHITNAIADAKSQLQALQAKYRSNEAAAGEFNMRIFPTMSGILGSDHPLLPVPGLGPLIMRQYQERLDQQARDIMTATDVRVDEAAKLIKSMPVIARIDVGPMYDPEARLTNHGRSGNSGEGTHVPAPKFDTPPPSALPHLLDVAPPLNGNEAPALAGGPQFSPSPKALPLSPASPGSLPDSQPIAGPWPPTSAGQAVKPWFSKTGNGATALRPGGVIGSEGPQERIAPRSSLPVSGVLGGAPNNGATVARGGTSPSVGATRGSPLLSPNNSHRSPARPPFSHGESASSTRTSSSGWRDHSFEQYVERRRIHRQMDPGDPWEVGAGVAPVLDAPRLPKGHDAGSGVIGIDR
ncbi:hypothetical protein Drose_04950 [Dactylosporangium roseum]|uniref:PPE family domain-containing protein n=1 Tax=Dactylosporangium roseum TaxID=47989 RepID=A0ABY5Z6F8_9ACTN|nr:hypothetical protein [Dactylosporangium roseum]UWZ37630.1 hypothetical protein Drose_04950 [Dactylosporangium roseum]